MHKKLMMACMAIAAFAAFVMAPAASAHELTEGGATLAVGSSITGKNNGITKFTGGFGVECEVAHLKGTVTKNNGTDIEGTIPVGSATFTNAGGAACGSALGATTVKVTSEICLATIPKTNNITVDGCLVETGGVKVTEPVTFDLTTGGITCRYSQATLTGTLTTGTPGKAGLNGAAASEEEPRSFFCPDTGSLDMTFELFTTNGTAVTLS